MTQRKFGLAVVGNALVDILTRVDDSVVDNQPGMARGKMTLIDRARAGELGRLIKKPDTVMSGGSGANTLSGFVSFGGKGALIAKVANDRLGRTFRDDMASQSIAFPSVSHRGAEKTGRCYVLVTPDGERTMNTYLGASTKLTPADVKPALITDAETILLEGYAFDHPDAKAAFLKAASIAAQAGIRVAFTLSDARCVDRHHEDFVNVVRDHSDIIFANEKEIRALTLKEDFNEAVRAAANMCDYTVITRGAKGALIVNRGETTIIPAAPVQTVVDTTGAGDAFAAGILAGLHLGFDPDECGRIAAEAAAATIQHIGARSPHARFSDLLKP